MAKKIFILLLAIIVPTHASWYDSFMVSYSKADTPYVISCLIFGAACFSISASYSERLTRRAPSRKPKAALWALHKDEIKLGQIVKKTYPQFEGVKILTTANSLIINGDLGIYEKERLGIANEHN